MHPLLFWIGLGLILTAVLVILTSILSCFLHCGDDTGSSGGFDGIEVFCLLPFSITFIIGGIFCMVSTATWCLYTILFVNLLSAFVHMFTAAKCTGCRKAEPGASQAITKKVGTAWIRLIPELLGIILSLVAVGLAIDQMTETM